MGHHDIPFISIPRLFQCLCHTAILLVHLTSRLTLFPCCIFLQPFKLSQDVPVSLVLSSSSLTPNPAPGYRPRTNALHPSLSLANFLISFSEFSLLSTSLSVILLYVPHDLPLSPGSLRIPLQCSFGVVSSQRMSYRSPPSLPNVISNRILSCVCPYLFISYPVTPFYPKQFADALIYKKISEVFSLPIFWPKRLPGTYIIILFMCYHAVSASRNTDSFDFFAVHEIHSIPLRHHFSAAYDFLLFKPCVRTSGWAQSHTPELFIL